jgi:CSLREA domain-containing protein
MKARATFYSLIGTVLLFLCARTALAATFNIANGDVAGLISAISTANSNNQDDIINLAAGGNYTVTAAASGEDGFPIITSDSGHSLTINGNSATISRSGTASFRFFHNQGHATISSLTMQGGSASSSDAVGGGAVANEGGTLTVQFCTFTNNSMLDASDFDEDGGGAVYNSHTGTLTVLGCTFTGNNICYKASGASSGGGAICNDGRFHSSGHPTSATITSCVFSNNTATGCGPESIGSSGGAILNVSSNGTADASITVSNCTFSDNSSTFSGGGIENRGATVSVSGCTFNGNSVSAPTGVGAGGAVTNVVGTMSVTNCTFNDNHAEDAQGQGGAIYNFAPNTAPANLTVTSCTLAGDSSTSGGEIYNYGSSTATATTTIRNTILKAARGANLANNGSTGPITSQGYNLSSDNGGGFLVGTADQLNTDPKLDPLGLQHNGAAIKTIALIYGSPAIDKGNSFGLTTDERGAARPVDSPSVANASGGDGSDIGAYEAPADAMQAGPNYVVNTVADHDDGTCGGADCTLREAINQANAAETNSSLIITFSVLGTITLNSELGITRSMTITGPAARNLVIGGNSAHRIFDISAGNISISGVTIRDGNFVTDGGVNRQGGGVYSTATNLSFSDCEFFNNTANGVASGVNGGSGGSGQGGAIFSTGNLSLTRCTFRDNSATGAAGNTFTSNTLLGPGGNGGAAQGGAVLNDTTGTLTIVNCTFTNSTVTGGNGGSGNSGTIGASGGNADGGAVCNLGTMTVTSATVSVNAGTGGAGAAFGFQRHGPNGTGNGGLADVNGSSSHVANTIVAGNTGSTAPDAEGTFISSGYNLIGIGDQSTGFSASMSDQVGTAAAPINPQLAGLGDNGGSTDTMAPLGTSPAVDQGFSFGFTTDQRGQPRTFDEPSIPNASDGTDIGAVETDTQLGPTFVVGTTEDHDDGICSYSDCTLREAIHAANSVSGPNTVTFSTGVTGTITLEPGFGLLNIASDMTIIGPGARTLAVSGNSAIQVFFVSGGSSTISGLTIRDGSVLGFSTVSASGGAIVNSATLTLNDCTLTNNHASGADNQGNTGGAGGIARGGAVYNSAVLTLNRCTFSGNSLMGGHGGFNFASSGTGGAGGAAQGAALFNDANGSLSIKDCTFNGNTAIGGTGGNGNSAGPGGSAVGGLFNVGTMSVTASTISGNSGTGGAPGIGSNPFAGRGTGGVSALAGTSTVGNTIIAVNSGNNGGGMDVSGIFTSSGYNLVGTTTHSTGFTATGDQTGSDVAKLDPKLGSLQNNGGGTDTIPPLSGSPVIDAGKSFGLTTDQRGGVRTVDTSVPNATGGDGTDIGAYEVDGQLAAVNAASRKYHGTTKPTPFFDVPLPLTGPIGIECRRNTGTDPQGTPNFGHDHEIIFTFPSNVTGPASVSVTDSNNMTIPSTFSASGNVVTVDLHSVPNPSRLAISLTGVSDGTDTADLNVPMGVLLGDTTANGAVNSSDIAQTQSQSGQPVNSSNFREDVTVNGSINSSDIASVQSKSGTALPVQ